MPRCKPTASQIRGDCSDAAGRFGKPASRIPCKSVIRGTSRDYSGLVHGPLHGGGQGFKQAHREERCVTKPGTETGTLATKIDNDDGPCQVCGTRSGPMWETQFTATDPLTWWGEAASYCQRRGFWSHARICEECTRRRFLQSTADRAHWILIDMAFKRREEKACEVCSSPAVSEVMFSPQADAALRAKLGTNWQGESHVRPRLTGTYRWAQHCHSLPVPYSAVPLETSLHRYSAVPGFHATLETSLHRKDSDVKSWAW